MNRQEKQRSYIAIDLKSFYASAECMTRNLDPLKTNLVVADASRTEKTICLAVSPSLKAYGIPGRARLFEVVSKVKEVNAKRVLHAPGHRFQGTSSDADELALDPGLAVDYIVAPPRMAYYMELSTQIYEVYLKYLAPEDIHVYSIDEVMCDVTDYLETYGLTPRELASAMIMDVYRTTGITATGGVGTNLYLCKVAMDVLAKKTEPDENGVRIAELDEISYRKLLWTHRPLTDFWRVGKGYASKLEQQGIFTMGDIARCSLGNSYEYYNEDLLYRMFGVNAELLIDHAWGWEPCTMKEIKQYRPESSSIGSGQVLQCPYDWEKGKLIVREMTELLVLDLVEKKLLTNQVVLTVGYDIENLTDPKRKKAYKGEVKKDYYGRMVPKHAHGTANLDHYTSSTAKIIDSMMQLYDRIVDPALLVRRINVTACHVLTEEQIPKTTGYEQLDLFTDYDQKQKEREKEEEQEKREQKMQQAMIDIKHKFGKNAILKGMNLEEGAMTMKRNDQIGGHKA